MERSKPPTSARKPAARPARAARPPAPPESPPAGSADRAQSAFENFSLSRFPPGAERPSHVDPGDGPAAVSAAQRRVIKRQLDQLAASAAAPRGVTLALPAVSIRKLLPSLDENSATVELGDVLNVIGRQLRGTEFYANGNPVVARLALQERARQLIAILQQGDAPPPVDAPPPGNEPPLGDAPPVHRPPVKSAAQPGDEKATPRPRRGRK